MKLHGRIWASQEIEPRVIRLTRFGDLPIPVRETEGLLVDKDDLPRASSGFGALVLFGDGGATAHGDDLVVVLPESMNYLEEGDILRINPRANEAHVLYRRSSRHNSLLVTERCNSNCTMCSQPPRDIDDRYIVDDLLAAIPLMAPSTKELGITGGEPTLLGDDLIRLVEATKSYLPDTALHILSNGRLFAYSAYVQKLAQVEHPDLVWGVPLYSDLPERHDFVVQSMGAFDETIRGMLNLARFGQRVELRMVIHRHTYDRLPEFAQFVTRNIPFVEHVALMGLEIMGHVKMNLEALWIDPTDYQSELRECVFHLDEAGIQTSIYNHQLCVLDRSLWPFSVKSISDWKNVYLPECDGCNARNECGGFFSSSRVRHSEHINPIIDPVPV